MLPNYRLAINLLKMDNSDIILATNDIFIVYFST